ncbi:MAG: DUF2341 domain-containing protein [Candidatus Hodarchaeota archaeon]
MLIIILISIILPHNNINLNKENQNFNNKIDDITFKIQTSSSNPPNIAFFTYYKTITINHENVYGFGSYENFPVLISILDSDLHDHVNQSNGNDIAFAKDTDWLDHEIEVFNQAYNGTHAQLVAWVRVPNLSNSTDTIINIYYGNATMSSRQNPTGVWSNNYRGVWHLSEYTGKVLDSTSYNTSGTIWGTVTRNSTGKVDGAYNFGTNDEIDFNDPADGHLDFGTGSFTISFWLNITIDNDWYQIPLYKGATTNDDIGYDFETNADVSALSFRICDDSENMGESPHIDISGDIGDWIYITGVVDRASDRIRIFKNGLQEGSGSNIAGIGNINTDNHLLAPNSVYDLYGLLDEIRICNIQRSAGWIATEYSNQNDPGSFYNLSSELIIDMIAPTYSNPVESSDPLELGETEVIQVNVSDPSGILEVKIEFEGTNHTMDNIGGDTWQYNSWIPSIVGNYTYKIFMQDKLGNRNSTTDSIEVIDTTPPTYSNLIESSDPLELSAVEVIQIDVSDLSGIFEVKIEFEGLNHSMSNIGGNTWQYDSWTPNSWIIYQYKIYMEDNNGNWNITINNITVQDTISPPPPTLNNPPGGDLSGDILFDWFDGSDPSGISYYILIIDNETDPSITPGYVFKINITNFGILSSRYELTEKLPSGKYYYFLAQIDGAGHQSEYTMGSFTINLNPNDNSFMIYIIIAVVVVSAVGSISVITIVRKKSHKKLGPPKKKVPFKVILGHITKLLPLESILDEIQLQDVLIQKEQNQSYSEVLSDKFDSGINIDEVKVLGEELFAEGAYLEAIKQFKHAKEILSKQGRNEEVVLISDLIAGIEALIEEREKRLELLETEKIEGDAARIFELYYNIIEISKKLRDLDVVSMYQSELIQYFQMNQFKLNDIEQYRSNLEHEADSLSNNGFFERAAQIYGKCERISEIFIQSERDGEIANIEKYRKKEAECLNKIKEKNSRFN